MWTDYNNIKQEEVNWQVYAIDSSGEVNFERTIWTQSVEGFEAEFDQDIDLNGKLGFDSSNLTYALLDLNGHRLMKDEHGALCKAA